MLKQTDSGDFSITDLDSTNHTRVNSQVIQSSVLRNGDAVQFGDILAAYESEFVAPPRIEEQATQIYTAPPVAAPPAPPVAASAPAPRVAGPVPGRQPYPVGRAPVGSAPVGAADGCFAILLVGIFSMFAFIGGAWARHSSDHNGETLSTWVKSIMIGAPGGRAGE